MEDYRHIETQAHNAAREMGLILRPETSTFWNLSGFGVYRPPRGKWGERRICSGPPMNAKQVLAFLKAFEEKRRRAREARQ